MPFYYVDLLTVEEAEKLLVAAERLIDKSVSDGIQKKNTGSRQKSEIRRLVNSIK